MTSVTPSSGSPLGGYSVDVGGTGFTGATTVDFGTAVATNPLVSSTSVGNRAGGDRNGGRDGDDLGGDQPGVTVGPVHVCAGSERDLGVAN